MSEQKQYILEELKAKLNEKSITEQFTKDQINFDSDNADYIDDRFTFVMESLFNLIDKIYE